MGKSEWKSFNLTRLLNYDVNDDQMPQQFVCVCVCNKMMICIEHDKCLLSRNGNCFDMPFDKWSAAKLARWQNAIWMKKREKG